MILDIRKLNINFTSYGQSAQVLHDVSMTVAEGERVALIGQSGSGKTVTMRAIVGTLPMPPANITSGSIHYRDKELLTLNPRARNQLKGSGISIILQDPLLSFNPVLSIARQMDDVVRFANARLGRRSNRQQRRKHIVETLKKVQLSDVERVLKAYPMMLSGGMRQRVLIALSLLNRPRLLIADEPGTALDVTTQEEILKLLNQLVREAGLSLLLITHNLGVVREMADRVYVMQRGRIVESGTREQIFAQANHPYTQQLMRSVPPLYGDSVRKVENKKDTDYVIELNAVSKQFVLRGGLFNRPIGSLLAVNKVSLGIRQGDIFGIAGESGSGKTTLARLILGFYQANEGQVTIDGKKHSEFTDKNAFRKRIQIVYQNPGSSLNPKRTVFQALEVPLKFTGQLAGDTFGHNKKQIRQRVQTLLEMVDLPASYASMYPHELSGGQKQRVAIARALSVDPQIIVLDEPTSALDVLVQSTVIELLLRLREELDLTYVFISHDLSLMRNFCNRVAIMFRGSICEQGNTQTLFDTPTHPYTKALLSSIPVISEAEALQKPKVSDTERKAVLFSSTGLSPAP